MNVVICGAGEVGSHAAEVLSTAGHNITVIDQDGGRLRFLEDQLDVRTLQGNCAHAQVLKDARTGTSDLLVAATNSDEVNLLTAAVSKGVGVGKSIARVQHGAYFEGRGLHYPTHLNIDRLICPDYTTAQAIACTLRNPGSLAIENFGRGRIEMQEFEVTDDAPAANRQLSELKLPEGSRLAAVRRDKKAFLPDAGTIVHPGDAVILVGNADVFQQARLLFHSDKAGRRRIAVMGGTPMTVWLSRALRDRHFSIRVFETDLERAEELASKLDWVTVIQANPTDRVVFEEERLHAVDVFAALTDDDEQNILGCAWAKSMGVAKAISVVQRADYFHLLEHVGIDYPFSPRRVAAREIEEVLDDSPLRCLASLAEGIIDVYRVRIGKKSDAIGRPLKDIRLTPHWMIAGIDRADEIRVPGADSTIEVDDTVLVIGRHGNESKLKKMLL